VLSPLAARVERLANEQRYEEAAWARDRHRALVRALEARFRWRSMVAAGLVELVDQNGRLVAIDHGRLADPGLLGPTARLTSPAGAPAAISEVPPSVEAGEEAAILWRWLTDGSLRLVDATGTLASPTRQPTALNGLAA